MPQRSPPATAAAPINGPVVIMGRIALFAVDEAEAIPVDWLEPPPLEACVRGICVPVVQLVGALDPKLI